MKLNLFCSEWYIWCMAIIIDFFQWYQYWIPSQTSSSPWPQSTKLFKTNVIFWIDLKSSPVFDVLMNLFNQSSAQINLFYQGWDLNLSSACFGSQSCLWLFPLFFLLISSDVGTSSHTVNFSMSCNTVTLWILEVVSTILSSIKE